MYQGVVVLNKEPGFTSFDAVAVCRGIFGQKAVGHTGTLDPMARGVLPICLGRATKLSELLTSSEKEYEVEMQLGRTTDTDDITGKVIEETSMEAVKCLTEEQVRDTLLRYQGDSLQIPPRYAAIKKDGRKLYEYARSGVEVDVEGRPISIYELDVLKICLPFVHFRVRCSKGTYIRSLCRDVGKDLGTGAVMSALLRRKTGGFTLEEAVTLEELKEAKKEGQLMNYVRPMDQLLQHFRARICTEEGRKFLNNGNPLRPEVLISGDPFFDALDIRPDDPQSGSLYRVYLDGTLAALYRYDESKKLFYPVKMLKIDQE